MGVGWWWGRSGWGGLRAAGERVSRRSLRAAGLRGSNAELGAVAVMVGTVPGAPPGHPAAEPGALTLG